MKERQLVSDQVSELEKNQIKSGLDVSFANVDLAQAQLLLIQAQNECRRRSRSYRRLWAIGRSANIRTCRRAVAARSACRFLQPAIQQALQNRPELIGQRLDANSAQSYATAERDLWLPTISAVGTAGLTPVRAGHTRSALRGGGIQRKHPDF